MTATAQARVARLLLWYPPSWRARYGDEFAELLAAEVAEQPRSRGRAANVIGCGLRARLADVGLAGHPLDHAAAARAGLATLACGGAAFATFGVAIWSQLATGLQWAGPGDRGLTQALDLMSLALLTFGVAGALGLAGLTRAVIVAVARGDGRRLARPAGLAVAAGVFLLIGGRHFANAWPGTGGHLLAAHGLVPPGIAAFGWATTMWISAYWAHPHLLAAFPAAQIAWMMLAPLAAVGLITGVAQLLRRADRSHRALAFETWLGRVAVAGMLLFLGGALRWLWSVAAPGPGLGAAFHLGSVDGAGLAGLLAVAAVAVRALRRSGIARRALAPGGPGAPGC